MTDYLPPIGGDKRYYPELDETTCVDSDGEVWPEHDYPPVEEGSECSRCGAEADDEAAS
ncbi:hypothetical protein GCM10009837_06930 [Streptomyces durmitorensis]|uniref:Uncharacterized protein n=1 Tax=Streptomyces durmitorensis TaxID=319947 RepID=A0ABY4PMX8_9ACTN|nr:hypothetical protein [Streptomyces durmitorensis]UQT54411.1 hypothetical protein M4V62_04515 [Streptomyces durmitorensis]